MTRVISTPRAQLDSVEARDVHEQLVATLQHHNATFRVMEHSPEGQTELASLLRGHSLSQAAKSLVMMVKQGKHVSRYFLCVVPGDCRVDLALVKRLGSGTHAALAPATLAEQLTGCTMGAVPPVPLHPDLELLVDPKLLENTELVFNSGRLDRSIFLQRDCYVRIFKPWVNRIT
jgi:Ala-tRNA(Pro) deacylase